MIHRLKYFWILGALLTSNLVSQTATGQSLSQASANISQAMKATQTNYNAGANLIAKANGMQNSASKNQVLENAFNYFAQSSQAAHSGLSWTQYAASKFGLSLNKASGGLYNSLVNYADISGDGMQEANDRQSGSTSSTSFGGNFIRDPFIGAPGLGQPTDYGHVIQP